MKATHSLGASPAASAAGAPAAAAAGAAPPAPTLVKRSLTSLPSRACSEVGAQWSIGWQAANLRAHLGEERSPDRLEFDLGSASEGEDLLRLFNAKRQGQLLDATRLVCRLTEISISSSARIRAASVSQSLSF